MHHSADGTSAWQAFWTIPGGYRFLARSRAGCALPLVIGAKSKALAVGCSVIQDPHRSGLSLGVAAELERGRVDRFLLQGPHLRRGCTLDRRKSLPFSWLGPGQTLSGIPDRRVGNYRKVEGRDTLSARGSDPVIRPLDPLFQGAPTPTPRPEGGDHGATTLATGRSS